MKRLSNMLLALVIALTALPAAVYAEGRSVQQRVADIRAEYNITVTYDDSVINSLPEYLDDVEAALKILGPVFTKQATKQLWRRDRTFRLEIVAFPSTEKRAWVDAQYYYDTTWDSEQVLSLYVKPEKRINTKTVIHEFGHMLHNCVGYEEFIEINGGKESYRNPVFKENGYVSTYAMMDDCEDFAETFAFMVMQNEKAAEGLKTLSTTSKLYKKYLYVYESIRSTCGPNSRLTLAAAEFLGIQIEK